MKRFFHITGSVLLALLILICIPFTVPKAFGLSIYEVITDSMTPDYPVGSVIYVETEQPENIKVDDVITFSIGTDTSQVMTHRVVAIDYENQTFTTKGDANNMEDVSLLEPEQIIGTVILTVPLVGYAAELLKEKTVGMLLLLMIFQELVFLVIEWKGERIEKRRRKQI